MAQTLNRLQITSLNQPASLGLGGTEVVSTIAGNDPIKKTLKGAPQSNEIKHETRKPVETLRNNQMNQLSLWTPTRLIQTGNGSEEGGFAIHSFVSFQGNKPLSEPRTLASTSLNQANLIESITFFQVDSTQLQSINEVENT